MDMLGYSQYQKAAARTQNKELTDKERFLHSALGLNAEIEELRVVKMEGDTAAIEDEAGDVLWMIAEMCDTCNLNMNALFTSKAMEEAELERAVQYDDESNPPKPRKLHFDTTIMGRCAARIAGYAQKTLQGHEIVVKNVGEDLQLLMACLKHLASYHGFSIRHAMYANIEKLKKRYPMGEGFSSERSVHREEDSSLMPET